MKLLSNKSSVTEVIPHDVNALQVNTDARQYSRLGWLIVLAGFGGFLLWALFAPLDKGVPVSGTVVVASSRKAIQHPTGGIVDDILVKDGENVKAGQVLVRMNTVQTKSNVESTLGQYIAARVTEARLIAERDGRKAPVFPESLAKYRNDPRIAANISTQNQLFYSRQAALQGELAAMDESVSGLKSQIAGLSESRDSKKEQMILLKEQLVGMRELAKEGYVPRNRLLDLERTYAQLSGAVSEDIGNIGRSQRQVSELAVRRIQRQQEYQKEVRTQLTQVQTEADAMLNRLRAQEFELSTTELKSPVNGSVVGMSVFTRGGVVAPGAKLMEIVPTEDALVVEGQVPVNLIDRVHPDLRVDLIFSAFNQNKTPHIPGMVTKVSADRFLDEHTGMPYYRMQAKVTPEGMAKLKNLQVRPGMPVELFVKTGERTMMSYLLKPIFDRAKTSLTEE